ncbi:MAG: PIG-L family deacetylase [bacterium]
MNNLISKFDDIFPPGITVVFLHAHPDDESFLSAGLIQEMVKRGRECIIVYSSAALISGNSNTKIRQNEATRSCRLLGVKEVVYLEFCEPKYTSLDAIPLADQSPQKVCESFFSIINKHKISTPFILVSYDKNGGYGNLDHKITNNGAVTFKSKYPKLIYSFIEVTINRDRISEWLKYAKQNLSVKLIPKLSYWSVDFGLSSKEIDYFYILTNKQNKLKKEALSKHATQIRQDEFPLALTDFDFKKVLGIEYIKIH